MFSYLSSDSIKRHLSRCHLGVSNVFQCYVRWWMHLRKTKKIALSLKLEVSEMASAKPASAYQLLFWRAFCWVLQVRVASGVDTEFPYQVRIVDRGVDCRDPVCRHHFRFPEKQHLFPHSGRVKTQAQGSLDWFFSTLPPILNIFLIVRAQHLGPKS